MSRVPKLSSTGIVYAVLLLAIVIGAVLTAGRDRNFFSTGNIDNILTGTVLPEVSGHVLERMAAGGAISAIRIGAGEDGHFTYAVD